MKSSVASERLERTNGVLPSATTVSPPACRPRSTMMMAFAWYHGLCVNAWIAAPTATSANVAMMSQRRR